MWGVCPIPKDDCQKRKPSFRKCVFLGYGLDNEIRYRLWDPKHRKIIRSSDVVFNESTMHKTVSCGAWQTCQTSGCARHKRGQAPGLYPLVVMEDWWWATEAAEKTLPWARMLSDMFDHLRTNSFGSGETNHWDAVFGKLDGHIKGCPFSSKLLKHWKDVLHHIKWKGRNSESGNSLRLESLH